MNPLEAMREGGFMMYPLVALGLMLVPESIVLGILAAMEKEGRNRASIFGVALIVSGLMPLALGIFAYTQGLAEVTKALAAVNPEDAATILAAGTGEALTPIIWGLPMAIIPMSVGFVLLCLGFSRQPRFAGT